MLCKDALLDSVLFASMDVSAVAETDIALRHRLGTPGAATGKVARSIEEADRLIEAREPFILVLPETRPEYIRYIEQAAGVVTLQGGITSHAAIITRQKGIPAIIGCGAADLQSGEEVTLDGSAGIVVHGPAPIRAAEPDNTDLSALLTAADGLSSETAHHITVKANADTPEDAAKARRLGAQGIGVVRTEHMFSAEDRLPHMQAMIMAANAEERQQHLDALFDMQKQDFKGILEAMDGLPVTIRLLDAPLHEFMPHDADDIDELATMFGVRYGDIEQRIEDLTESNPMLGKRAVRLGILIPEIYEMQARAILEAATELMSEGKQPKTRIMIPLVSEVGEVKEVTDTIRQAAAKIGEGCADFQTGIMVETPAACLNAAAFARHADFFSFGTNDLTQTTLGLSRDDTAEVIAHYLSKGIYQVDPFQTLHPQVAELMEMAVSRGKAANPNLDVSVCGEHGGDPASIRTCQEISVDVVSVSPPRIPVSRLVAAQAMLSQEHMLATSKWQNLSGSKSRGNAQSH